MSCSPEIHSVGSRHCDDARQGREGKDEMTTSTLLEKSQTEYVESEFDLDVKLQPVARNGSDDRPIRPTECSCVECDTNAQTCTGCGGG
jgi:hypothetical protein